MKRQIVLLITCSLGLALLAAIAVRGQQVKIKVELATRAKIILGADGSEQVCVQPESSSSSCLLLKVSGIDPNALVEVMALEPKTPSRRWRYLPTVHLLHSAQPDGKFMPPTGHPRR